MGWVLTDALYLHADWAQSFTASDTSPAPFTSAAGTRVTAKFMHGGPFRTTQAKGWTAVSLPYQGGKLAMLALLPPPGAGACPTLSAGTMTALTGGLAAPVGGKTRIALPEVSLSSKLEMNRLLGTLGMGQAFGPGADFSGAVAAGLLHRPGGARGHAQGGREGHRGQAATATGVKARRRGRPGADLVQPAIPADGGGPGDGRAAVPGPGGQPGHELNQPFC